MAEDDEPLSEGFEDDADDDAGREEEEEEEEEPEALPRVNMPRAGPSLPPRPPGARVGLPPARPGRLPPSRLEDVEGGTGAADGPLDEAALQRQREDNIKAMLSNSLQTCRQPIMSNLTITEGELILRKPFTSPMLGAPAMSNALRRKLAARRSFVPWGSSTPLPVPAYTKPTPAAPEPTPEPAEPEPPPAPTVEALPEGVEPLVLWSAPPDCPEGPGEVTVDPMLVRFLRPHQREGVQFMFDCVTGQRLEGKQGCILADDMGLGKTLQGITLMWTLLTSGHPLLGGAPIARRAIIVCPTSLVSNWDNECTKWLHGRLKTLAMCESSREDVVANIGLFLHPSNTYKVLIISYETFRLHAARFQVPHACDLLMCDEAHRLKNDATLTNRALDNLACTRRVLLSGTPMQNHLDEFFAMVDFCCPGVLGAPAQFRKYFELPILAGREPDADAPAVALGSERSMELSSLTNNFILRRTNKLLSQHLPPKVIEVVCCRLTDLQRQLYVHFLQSKAARRVLKGRTSGVLSAITSLKKLCNHPKLIYDAVHSKAAAMAGGDDGEARAEGFEDVAHLFPPGLFDNGRVGRGGMAHGWEAVSGKMAVLARMLHVLYTETNDRIVLVSNYTSMLDLFAATCRERGYPFVRLDGTTTINKRQKLVKVFNDPNERQFAFLLSSKAGGCGLNLIGANRLVLFDPDWNPANDQQAAARVWRDGQKKRVFVYRFLSSGSIEEKVFQRQLSKEGLKQLVSKNGKAAANVMTAEDLRELFSLNADTPSDTYYSMCSGPQQAAQAAAAAAAAEEEEEGAEAGAAAQQRGGGGPGEDAIDLAASGEGDDEEEEAAGSDWGSGDDGGGAVPGAGGARKRGREKERGSGAAEGACGGEAEPAPALRAPTHQEQVGEPAEEDLAAWGHHPTPDTIPDAVMRRIAAPDVSFVFSCRVDGKPIEGGDDEERKIEEGTGTRSGGTGGIGGGGRGGLGRPARGAGGAAAAAGGARPSLPAAAAGPPAGRKAAAASTPPATRPGPGPGAAAAGAARAAAPAAPAAVAAAARGAGPAPSSGAASAPARAGAAAAPRAAAVVVAAPSSSSASATTARTAQQQASGGSAPPSAAVPSTAPAPAVGRAVPGVNPAQAAPAAASARTVPPPHAGGSAAVAAPLHPHQPAQASKAPSQQQQQPQPVPVKPPSQSTHSSSVTGTVVAAGPVAAAKPPCAAPQRVGGSAAAATTAQAAASKPLAAPKPPQAADLAAVAAASSGGAAKVRNREEGVKAGPAQPAPPPAKRPRALGTFIDDSDEDAW